MGGHIVSVLSPDSGSIITIPRFLSVTACSFIHKLTIYKTEPFARPA